jgi:hypothetical protein
MPARTVAVQRCPPVKLQRGQQPASPPRPATPAMSTCGSAHRRCFAGRPPLLRSRDPVSPAVSCTLHEGQGQSTFGTTKTETETELKLIKNLLIVLRSGSTGHGHCSNQGDHVLKIVFQRCSLWFLSEHFARGGSHKIICCQAGNFCVWSLGCSRSRSYSCMHDWGDQFTIWYCDPCIDLGS